MSEFKVITGDGFIWNQSELLVYLSRNQYTDIVLDLNHEGACCTANGLYALVDQYQFKSVTVRTSNLVERHPDYIIQHGHMHWANVTSEPSRRLHHWDQTKIFGAYYGRPLWHRMGIASYLTSKFATVSHVNLRTDYANEDERKLAEVTQLYQYAPEQLADFAALAASLPLMVEDKDGYTPGQATTQEFTEQLASYYLSIFVDIVAETFVLGNSFFPTEKTFRPILLKKPFIVMGAANHLSNLRAAGFKTFGDYWDEGYDAVTPRDRYAKILQLVDFIGRKPVHELAAMYADMQTVLEHNYQLILEKNELNDK